MWAELSESRVLTASTLSQPVLTDTLAIYVLVYYHCLLTEMIPAEAQPESGTWGDGKGEDELSPEEIQMVRACSADSFLFHAFP